MHKDPNIFADLYSRRWVSSHYNAVDALLNNLDAAACLLETVGTSSSSIKAHKASIHMEMFQK